ncbi:MAG: riboflavin biosynthesis protein RibF, partial [Holosporales bacterium]
MTGVVAAIGNFDGLHCGHRQILEATRREAVRLGGKPAVITFNPHP